VRFVNRFIGAQEGKKPTMAVLKVEFSNDEIISAISDHAADKFGARPDKVNIIVHRGYQNRPGDSAPDTVTIVCEISEKKIQDARKSTDTGQGQYGNTYQSRPDR